MIDNRKALFPKDDYKLIAKLCDRRFGIGADGLILLENDASTDFKMVYFNADGEEGSMCGNGGRCIVAFAKFLGIIDINTTFMAVDGLHEATVAKDLVSLKMQNVTEIKSKTNSLFMDTGSPHHVQLVAGLKDVNVVKEGAKLRYGLYGESGSNINFVQQDTPDSFSIRTYERGVEDETLSCGTGVTAVALGMHNSGKTKSNTVKVNALGGALEVSFDFKEGVYSNIYLKGAVKQVYKGEVSW